jgi:hypothetical protein
LQDSRKSRGLRKRKRAPKKHKTIRTGALLLNGSEPPGIPTTTTFWTHGRSDKPIPIMMLGQIPTASIMGPNNLKTMTSSEIGFRILKSIKNLKIRLIFVLQRSLPPEVVTIFYRTPTQGTTPCRDSWGTIAGRVFGFCQ